MKNYGYQNEIDFVNLFNEKYLTGDYIFVGVHSPFSPIKKRVSTRLFFYGVNEGNRTPIIALARPYSNH